MTSRHASVFTGERRRVPSAASGVGASSRAKSSEISTTRPPASMSAQLMSRPAKMRVPIASK